MGKFTEEQLEQAFIELLGNEGFPHFLGNTISRAIADVLCRLFNLPFKIQLKALHIVRNFVHFRRLNLYKRRVQCKELT